MASSAAAKVRRIGGVVVVQAILSNAVARADDCQQPLSKEVRDEIVDKYSCGINGHRCLDGHVGRAFVKSTTGDTKGGYFDSNEYYELGLPGADIHVLVFVRHACADELLSGLGFTDSTVKNQDSQTEHRSAGDKITRDNTAETRAKIDMTRSLLPRNADGSSPPRDSQLQEAIAGLRQNLSALPASQAVLDQATRVLDDVSAAVQQRRFREAGTNLDRLDDVVTAIGGTIPRLDIHGSNIAMQEHIAQVRGGDDVAFFTLTTSNLVHRSADNDKVPTFPRWPASTLTIKVDHGMYYWDAGFLFANVFHATRTRDAAGNRGFDSATQSMVAGSVYFGRRNLQAFGGRNWIPGLQVGFNADLTKLTDAVSAGAIWQPLNGVGFSAGVILYERAKSAVASADTSPAKEHVFLPYIGITVSSSFLDSIKALKSNGKVGNASSSAPGKSENK